MKKLLKTLLVILLVIIEVGLIGCAMVPDLVTPCWIDPAAAKYADVNLPGILPYTTLHDARQVKRNLDFNHLLNQIVYVRLIEDDRMTYDYINAAHTSYIKRAEEFQAAVLSPTGPIGILLSGAAFGTMGALYIKRPGDKSKKEVEEIVNGNSKNG